MTPPKLVGMECLLARGASVVGVVGVDDV